MFQGWKVLQQLCLHKLQPAPLKDLEFYLSLSHFKLNNYYNYNYWYLNVGTAYENITVYYILYCIHPRMTMQTFDSCALEKGKFVFYYSLPVMRCCSAG